MCGAVSPEKNDCQRYLHSATVNGKLCMIGYFHMRGSDNTEPFALRVIRIEAIAADCNSAPTGFDGSSPSSPTSRQIAGGNILVVSAR
jgi:hypothetical protein